MVRKGNIGNAKTAGLSKDLGLSSLRFSWVLYSFYICYVFFRMDNSVMEGLACSYLHYHSVHLVSNSKMAKDNAFDETYFLSSWGITVMCAGTVHNMAGLFFDRCFLCIFEAAFGAGAPYFLSLFYH
jgi:hypothetical protein